MKIEEFTFDSRDGKTKLHAMRWLPDTEKPVAIVQIVHGMNEYIRRYDEFATYLAEHGIVAVGEDHLGHGESVAEQETFGYICENDPATVLVRDVHRLKKMTEEKYPGVPYFILGQSMGSFIVRNYITRYGTGITGAMIFGTGTPKQSELATGKLLTGLISKFRGPKYVSRFIDHTTTSNYMSGIENAKTKDDWLCTDEEVVARYSKDPLCSGFTFTVNGFHALFELAQRMQKKENLDKIPKKLPILIVSGTQDPVGGFGAAPKQLYDNYLNLDLTKTVLKLYNGGRHEMLNEKIKETVYEDVRNWIEMVLTQNRF